MAFSAKMNFDEVLSEAYPSFLVAILATVRINIVFSQIFHQKAFAVSY